MSSGGKIAITALWAVAALAAFSTTAHAQAQASRPIRLVVPLAPGGTNDTLARIVADRLGERLGQAVVVDNRPGANAQIGSAIVARANPDGNTLLMIGAGHAMNPSLIRKLPYDTERDFAPVGQVAGGPYVMVVHPAVPAKNGREFAAWVKSKPDVTYGSAGTGNPTHLAGELFRIAAGGLNMVHVPYKGGSAVMPDLLSGRIAMTVTSLATGGAHMNAGRLRPIGVTTRARVPQLPDVPTFMESGFPDFEVNAWYGMLTTGRTPRARVDRISSALQQVLSEAQTRETMQKSGLSAEPSSASQFADLIRRDTIKWAKVVKVAGIQPE
ncbi:MAG TPA: tripartite tricarboxylate transporter substrate binding protein [Burkholderiales bacterium]|nr:tripartite tricarboxylate transporter substrate binding protein [Burkholderiales bacterium]